MNVSKSDLLTDFEDYEGDITKSGLYKKCYTAEYGQFGGRPFGAIVANYYFNAHPQDIKLLQNCASVAAMAHAPFISAAGSEMLGEKSFETLPKLNDLKSKFEGPQYLKWHAFRESEDARYVGLVMPRFLSRLPYGKASSRSEERRVGKECRL